jgi:hypothetical protein
MTSFSGIPKSGVLVSDKVIRVCPYVVNGGVLDQPGLDHESFQGLTLAFFL